MDRRPSGLTQEVLQAELTALYNSIVIPVDDPSFSAVDIKKIKISTLLTAVNNLITSLQADKANAVDVLLKNNTEAYEPVSDYNPAVKKTVSDNVDLLLIGIVSDESTGFTWSKYKGRLGMQEATKRGNGHYRVTHNKGNKNYIVTFSTLPRGVVNDIQVSTYEKFDNYFEFRTIKAGDKYDGVTTFRMEGY